VANGGDLGYRSQGLVDGATGHDPDEPVSTPENARAVPQ